MFVDSAMHTTYNWFRYPAKQEVNKCYYYSNTVVVEVPVGDMMPNPVSRDRQSAQKIVKRSIEALALAITKLLKKK